MLVKVFGGQRFVLREGENRIGREEKDNDVVIRDKSMSAHHAVLEVNFDDELFTIKDLMVRGSPVGCVSSLACDHGMWAGLNHRVRTALLCTKIRRKVHRFGVWLCHRVLFLILCRPRRCPQASEEAQTSACVGEQCDILWHLSGV